MLTSKFDSKVANFWDRESRDWGDKYGKRTSYFYRSRTIYQLLASTGVRQASILDYGCGSGDITFPMLRDGHSVTGVDIAEGMVRKACERAEEFGLASKASYYHLDNGIFSKISSQKFDVIISSSVLEYVESDMSLVKTFHSILKDGGYLLVSIPDSKSFFCKLDKWMYANRRWMPRFIPIEKLGYLDIQKRQYDIGLFAEAVTKIGFKLLARKHNTITLQRGAIMEWISNIPGLGMLAIVMFQKTH